MILVVKVLITITIISSRLFCALLVTWLSYSVTVLQPLRERTDICSLMLLTVM